jgi:DNA polymerase-3 subunit beta
MKRSELKSALMGLKKFRPGRSTVPILKAVKVELAGECIALSATDLEIGARVHVPYDGPSFKPFAVKLKSLYRVISKLDAETVEINDDGEEPSFQFSDGTEYTGEVYDAEDFPDQPENERPRHDIKVSGEEFRKWEDKLCPAIGDEMRMHALTGMYFDLNGEEPLAVIGTDGNRLHRYRYTSGDTPPVKVDTGRDMSANFPKHFVQAVDYMHNTRLDEGNDLRISIMENKAVIETPRATYWCRQVEGNFPDYRKAIPSPSGETVVEIEETRDWKRAMETVNAVESDLPFSWIRINGNVEIEHATNSERVRRELPGEFSGEEEIPVNHEYVGDLCTAFKRKDESLEMVCDSPEVGILFRTPEDRFDAVIMPVDGDEVDDMKS